jgi:hypothetical protein
LIVSLNIALFKRKDVTCLWTLLADDTGQHVRIAVYNTGAATTAEAAVALPLGARFVLKNPFLKRCNDQWLGLRVDQPDDLVGRCRLSRFDSSLTQDRPHIDRRVTSH